MLHRRTAPSALPAAAVQKNVLVVDDDAASRRLLAAALRSSGFAVITAEDGEAALRAIYASPPDAVVLDFEMPGMDGASVCGCLRDDPRPEIREIPVIMLTAHTGEADEIRCLQAGANDFVTKPVSREVLGARIETRLRLRALNDELRQQNEELARWRAAHEADLATARATQRAIVPSVPPVLAGWEVRSIYSPLIQVGGDVYGWRPCGDGRWLFWLADATGHGASAALFTALTTLLFFHASASAASPGQILTRVNEEFCEVFGGRYFMSACCAIVTPTGATAFASAGHPPVLIRRNDGSIEAIPAHATMLGLQRSLSVGQTETTLAPGEVALLYTDGLYSLLDPTGERMTPEAVTDAFRACDLDGEILPAVLDLLRQKGNSDTFDDDVAALSLRRVH
jgi:phosphoserine phosphatase RsbU/P